MISEYYWSAIDRGRTFVLVPKFKKFATVEVPPVWKKPRDIGMVREECAMSGMVVDGGDGIPIIDDELGCICDDQGPYANFQ